MARSSAQPQYETLESLIAATATMVRPPERLTVAEAAAKYRYVNNPGSYVGPWDNDFAPYLVEPMEVLTSLDYQGMVFAGPIRSGKSDMYFNWAAYTAECDPADMMVVHMTQASARDWSQGDFRKAIRDTQALRNAVLPGKQNQNTHDIRFKSGMRVLVKWPTITELSGKTIPRHWLMDYDRMPLDVDKEGTPFDLTKNRGVSFRRYAMTAAESSPGYEVEDPRWIAQTPHQAPPTQGILSLYNRGDRRRWYWQCRDCRESFEPDFDLLVYPETEDIQEASEAVVMACPHCGSIITPDMKHEMNMAGRWIKDRMRWNADGSVTGVPISSNIASFWLKGPAAAFASWTNQVASYLRAMEAYEQTGNEKDLQTTVNTDQGKPYLPMSRSDSRLPEDLKARMQDLGDRVVPDGVRFLTAEIDVQQSMFVVQIHGHMPGDDTAVIDRFRVRVSERWSEEDQQHKWVKPGAYPEDWDLLTEQVLLKTYPLSDDSGRRMAIKAALCDSGGQEGVTANAYEWWRRLRDEPEGRQLHRRVRLGKGSDRRSAPRVQISYPDSERKDRKAGARGEVPVLIMNSDVIKDTMDQRLDRTEPGGGMILFPDWLEDWWFMEVVAEHKDPRKGWVNPNRRRNEAWDLLCYSHALCLSPLINIESLNWENPPGWAAEWDDNDLVFDDNSNRPFDPQPKVDYNLSDLANSLA